MTKKDKSELEFEKEVVAYLTQIGGVRQWEYLSNIKKTNQLWDNFKSILEKNNQSRIENPLSETEFNQVKRAINNLSTPYKAGQFLYGINGTSEVEVVLDNGKTVFLTIFDQNQIGGGTTIYQVVNQIERKNIIDGKQNRRFDVTLLINGLPIIQIELKKSMHTTDESLNQMKQYIAERQYSDIFSTTQILIAMTPHDIKYMANTKLKNFNKAFAFQWQDKEDATPVRSWKDFADKVLSIPMAHELSTRYMILDGTKNKETLKVMRPYQVYATKKVLEKIRKYDFKYENGNLGYIWHTTGSGKTITSFKTAWLSSRLSNVDKVIFLVDRIALTNQTVDAYKAYDPLGGFDGKEGVINNTENVSDLHRKLTRKTDKNIIVTSIQKMARYVKQKNFKPLNERILFIVDEAHRSTGQGTAPGVEDKGMLENIRQAIPTSAWVGYTGTPKFPETNNIFGELLHAYTIKEAIADRNVLGFKVEFKETIKPPENPTDDDIDDNLKSSIYDTDERHVKEVVKDILQNWKLRSNNRKYNALFTVHVGGNKASSPRVMEYFYAFQKEQEDKPEDEKLKIAVSFSQDTANTDNQTATNQALHEAIKHYNKMFNRNFDMTTVSGYTEELASRLNKTIDDGVYLDLVIVIDQLLTGFDAPEMNTLYIDRTLKNSNLIQAYSRTNRVHNWDYKPWGNVVNYRWPEQNKYHMNEAFTLYSNRENAKIQASLFELEKENIDSGILAKPYEEVLEEMKELISEINTLTNGFKIVPHSEREQEVLYGKLREYNQILNKLKQYPYDEQTEVGFPFDKEEFYEEIGISENQEVVLTTDIARDLKERLVKRENIDLSQIDLEMTHIHEIKINYDYLVELIAKMADEVHENKMEEAQKTYGQINSELSKTKNEKEYSKIKGFVDQIIDKEYVFESYPVPRTVDEMEQAMKKSQIRSTKKVIADFINKWGLGDAIRPKELDLLISKHRKGQDDLDKQGELTNIINIAQKEYQEQASDEVAQLNKIQYRKQLRIELMALAEKIKENE